jgi:hypothetical protein
MDYIAWYTLVVDGGWPCHFVTWLLSWQLATLHIGRKPAHTEMARRPPPILRNLALRPLRLICVAVHHHHIHIHHHLHHLAFPVSSSHIFI